MINTAGGVTGGDRFDWRFEVGDGADCVALTQACEKAYRADAEPAQIRVNLAVGAGGRLDWLPQETILFDRARLERRFEADLTDDGRLLVIEAVILGRRAMGETAQGARLIDRWRVRRDGRLIFADAFRLAPASEATGPARLEGAGAYALVLLLGADAESRLDRVRASLASIDAGAHGGVSAFDSKLICRILARDGAALRRALLPVMSVLRDGGAPPRLWMV
jgi:urease accessory protein